MTKARLVPTSVGYNTESCQGVRQVHNGGDGAEEGLRSGVNGGTGSLDFGFCGKVNGSKIKAPSCPWHKKLLQKANEPTNGQRHEDIVSKEKVLY